MKRIIAIMISLLMVLSTSVFSVAAAEEVTTQTTQTVEYLADGSYVVTVVEQTVANGARSTTTVGNKTKNYYSADHVLQWKMVVTGEFLYDGVTSSCTYASGTTTVYNTGYWSVTSENAAAGSTTAYYNTTFACWTLGVVISRPTYSVDLSCDQYGNLY